MATGEHEIKEHMKL